MCDIKLFLQKQNLEYIRKVGDTAHRRSIKKCAICAHERQTEIVDLVRPTFS